MSEWRAVALGDVVDIFDFKRIPLSSAQRSSRKGPFPYYGAQGVIDQCHVVKPVPMRARLIRLDDGRLERAGRSGLAGVRVS
jgi:hypothetical protein